MTATIAIDEPTWLAAIEHLQGRVEQVGFFLADYDEPARRLVLGEFRALPPEAFEIQSSVHVTLRDAVRPEILGWATRAGAGLVEAHSHVSGPACFSGSDIWGFSEWVPHVRWRLRRRPYAAILIAEGTFDAFAWIEPDAIPEQVTTIDIEGRLLPATGLTLPRWGELEAWRFRV